MKRIRIIGLIIDLAMYILMLLQMSYALTGNDLHEWLGIGFFLCLIFHIIIKRKWFVSFFKRKNRIFSARGFADLLIIMLLIDLSLLMFSSLGVSRTLFPNIHFLGNPWFHQLLATLGLTIAVVHGGMHGYFATKNKKRMAIGIAILAIIAFSIGQYGVPYMDRHFKVVEVTTKDDITSSNYSFNGGNPLVVYFTRVGNTDFTDNVDAVSGASLLVEDGILRGNTEFMAGSLVDMLGCDARAIIITEYKYPSSYSGTCSVAGVELKNQTRPEIEPIDVSEYDQIILVYPIWWGTIPMPVASFIEQGDFTGKDIYLIATQGSSGFASSTEDIKALIPEANVIETLSIYCDDIPESADMIREWFVSNGLIYPDVLQ